ncbi:MAG: EamA family transporter [Candidatus Beckwithbacteria bacterium]|nr:EamA family transporter [Candidatus Beckwithbacteria bacterium]
MRFLLIFTPIILAAIGQLILKIGMNKLGVFNLWKTFTNPTIILGLFFYGASLILWLMVLSKEKLSFVYPLVAFSYVVTVFLSKLILGESVPALRWMGLFVIIIGILIVAKTA